MSKSLLAGLALTMATIALLSVMLVLMVAHNRNTVRAQLADRNRQMETLLYLADLVGYTDGLVITGASKPSTSNRDVTIYIELAKNGSFSTLSDAYFVIGNDGRRVQLFQNMSLVAEKESPNGFHKELKMLVELLQLLKSFK